MMSQNINLAVQFLMLGMLGGAHHLLRKKQSMWHAQLMTLAFGMNTISFLLVMVPI